MPARRALVTQEEVKRVVKGVLAGGLRIGRVEVDPRTGRIVMFPEGATLDDATPNPCDDRLLR